MVCHPAGISEADVKAINVGPSLDFPLGESDPVSSVLLLGYVPKVSVGCDEASSS